MDFNGIFNGILGREFVGVIGPEGGSMHEGDDIYSYRSRTYRDGVIGNILIYMSTSSDPENGRFFFKVDCEPRVGKKFYPILIKRFGGRRDVGCWFLDVGLGNPDLKEVAIDFVGNIMGEIEAYRNEAHYEQYYSYGVYGC
jgi:hypothetical protein